jgi:hypothetical protein
MARVLYAVTATLPDRATLEEYVAWLEDGHVDHVIKGGAHSAMIVRLDPQARGGGAGPFRVETQYVFATRELFEQYEARHAPALRADGLKRFPPARGVTMERRIGEIV